MTIMETQTFESISVVHEGIVNHAKLDYAAVKKASLVLRSIDHALRQQIIQLLAEKKSIRVTNIYVKLRVEQSFASHLLGKLRDQQIVVAKRKGKEIYYSLDHARIAEVVEFLNKMQQLVKANN
jgi:DNA-binding transcriptional ArsR family regulator